MIILNQNNNRSLPEDVQCSMKNDCFLSVTCTYTSSNLKCAVIFPRWETHITIKLKLLQDIVNCHWRHCIQEHNPSASQSFFKASAETVSFPHKQKPQPRSFLSEPKLLFLLIYPFTWTKHKVTLIFNRKVLCYTCWP